VIRVRSTGLTFLIAAIATFACAWLLVDSPLAQGASGSAHAVGSKAKRGKACKKKRKRGVPCKKRHGHRASVPAGPRTVTLTWDSSADIDLQVYDLDGRHAGLQGGAIVNRIPGATHSGNDTDGFGPETFVDPSGRRVGYLACYVSGPYANVTLIDSGSRGAIYTAGLGPTGSPSDFTGAYTWAMGWGYLPIGAHC
jgi:uncharacterized protein YfaP (DUF2135 family)